MLRNNRLQFLKVLLLCFLTSGLAAQGLTGVEARFSNPRYEVEKGIYSVDVELKVDAQTAYLYGFNVRFFYDAELMEFKQFNDFAEGYDVVGARAPRGFIGNSNSGRQLFSMPGAAAYVNTGVQLVEEEAKALALKKDKWSKAFRAEFKVYDFVDTGNDFCPSIIWDLKEPNRSKGGFLGQGDGIVFTLLDKTTARTGDSRYSFSSATPFNWQYTNREEFPFGIPVAETCVSLSRAISVPKTLGETYQVFQNVPNPFNSETFVGFTIPKAATVRLRVFDSSGKTLFERTADFSAGTHQIRIEEVNSSLGASQTLYYQLATDEYLSPTFKMNRIKR